MYTTQCYIHYIHTVYIAQTAVLHPLPEPILK